VDWLGQVRAVRRDWYPGALSPQTHRRGGGNGERTSRGRMAGKKALLGKGEEEEMDGGNRMGRRDFVAKSVAAGVGAWAASGNARVLGAADRVRLGLIGAGA